MISSISKIIISCDRVKKFQINIKFDCSCEKVQFITEYIFSHFIQKSDEIWYR